jgi:hypothetical protein
MTGCATFGADRRGWSRPPAIRQSAWVTPIPGIDARQSNSSTLRLPDAPSRCRENNAYTVRRITQRNFSALSGLARRWQHAQECRTQFQLLSPTCAALREALLSHPRAPSSSTQSIQAEKLLLWDSWLPPASNSPFCIVGTSFFNQQYPYWRAMNLFLMRAIFAAVRSREPWIMETPGCDAEPRAQWLRLSSIRYCAVQ